MNDNPAIATILPAQECRNMAQVRIGVDATDHALVALLAQRFSYMNAAARIKADRAHVRDEDRKAQVLRNVADYAAKHGVPAEVVSGMWELLIEGSIAYELSQWDQNRS